MKLYRTLPMVAAAAMALVGATACQDDMEKIDNHIFNGSQEQVGTLLMDGITVQQTRSLTCGVAQPLAQDIQATYGVMPQMVEAYNAMYGEDALPMPAEAYNFVNPVAVIEHGAVTSSEVVIDFDLSALDRDLVYVLPVGIVDAPVQILDSKRVTYFVARGAALINVVANINETYMSLVAPGNADALSGIEKLTMQCMIKVDEFGKLISTVMGIEGNFLFRIGDAGVPDNQLQLATSSGNVTDPAWQFDTNKWIALTATFDGETGATEVYIDGVKKGSTQMSGYRGTVNWNSNNFFIGKSYDDNRYLDGCICEARVWNRILTPAEIAAKDQQYFVSPTSEGLVAYWKFNEGSGSVVKDWANGYDMICAGTINWIPVSLPK